MRIYHLPVKSISHFLAAPLMILLNICLSVVKPYAFMNIYINFHRFVSSKYIHLWEKLQL